MRDFVLCGLLGLLPTLWLASSPATAATFVVTNPNSSGTGSLLRAILDANAASGPDRIEFAIPGPGPFVIAPPSGLPIITSPVVIDGRTQPGYVPGGAPRIQLDGSNVPFPGSAFAVDLGVGTDGSEVHGLSITAWGSSQAGGGGIRIVGADSVVTSCYLGVTPGGTGIGNMRAVLALGPRARIGGDGTLGESGNVISGNALGVVFFIGASEGVVIGNRIGTDPTGLVALPNASGIEVDRANDVVIGGLADAERNLISGNLDWGIAFEGSGGTALRNRLLGNWIGLDASGLLAIPNGIGVLVRDATGTEIGSAASGNLIAGNASHGVLITGLFGAGTVIENNGFGLSAAIGPLPNGGNAIRVQSASENEIGRVEAPNFIAYGGTGDAAKGVVVADASDTTILGNLFFEVAGGVPLPIDLGDDGVSPNDAGDFDFGANDGQNSPELFSAELVTPTQLDLSLRIDGDPVVVDYPVFVDLYVSDASAASIREYLGRVEYTLADHALGTVSKTLPVSPSSTLVVGEFVVATATSTGNDTSEFSSPTPVPEPGLAMGVLAGAAFWALSVRRAGAWGRAGRDPDLRQ